MAIDTPAKRQSFFCHGGRFWKGKAYVADGSFGEDDRLHMLTFFSGNSLVTVTTGDIFVLDRHLVLPENP